MTRQNLLSLFFIALLLFILYAVFLILAPFFSPIFWSATIVFAFYPAHEWILKRLGGNRHIASILSTILIFLIFIPLVLFITIHIAQEAVALYDWIARAIRNGEAKEWIGRLRSFPLIHRIEHSELFQWDFIHENAEKWLLSSASFLGTLTLKQILPIARGLVSVVVQFFMMLFLVFFFLRDGSRIYNFIYRITPMEENEKKHVFEQLSETFSAVIRGQLVTAIIQGALAGAVFWLLKLPLPLFFAAATFFAAFIPVLGAAVIWMPFVIYLAATHQYVPAGILLFLGTCVISLADNVLKPLLIGKKTKLPYLLLFLGILGGVQVFGMIGIFLAPAVLSLFFVMIRLFQEKFFTEK